jgi:flagellar motor protein MotB
MRKILRQKINATSGDHGYLASVSDLMAVLFFLIMIVLMFFIVRTNYTVSELRSERVRFESARNSEISELASLRILKEAYEHGIEEYSKRTDQASLDAQELLQLRGLKKRYEEVLTSYNFLKRMKDENLQELARLSALEDMYTTRHAEMTDARQIRSRFLEYVKSRMDEQSITFDILVNEGIFRLSNDMLFDSAQFSLKTQGVEALDALAGILSDILPCYAGKRGSEPSGCSHPDHLFPGRFDVILIEGHTDSDFMIPRIKIDDNLQLSTFRSWSTYNHLMQAQPSLAELKNGEGEFLFGMSGYGEHRPVERIQETPEQKMRNRRVDFRIVLAVPEAGGQYSELQESVISEDFIRSGGDCPPVDHFDKSSYGPSDITENDG